MFFTVAGEKLICYNPTMLNKTEADIIEIIEQNKICSSTYLAKLMQVSKRSIINYVRQINEIYPDLILSSNKGYQINKDVHDQVIKENPAISTTDIGERKCDIAVEMMLRKNDSINISTTAFRYYISETTLRSTLYELKTEARECSLDIIFEKNHAVLSGSEKKKRIFLFRILSERNNRLEIITDVFPDLPVSRFGTALHAIINDAGYTITDYSFDDLLFSILITVVRYRLGHEVESDIYGDFLREDDYRISDKIAEYFRKKINISLSESEKKLIAVLCASRINKIQNDIITLENLNTYIWPDCYRMILEINEGLKKRYYIDFTGNERQFINFAMHIRAMIHRLAADITLNNPYLNEIKQNHINIYEAAVYIASIVSRKYPMQISEDEIAYLALHIGGFLETTIDLRAKIKVAFVMPNYYTVGEDLFRFYSSVFDKYIISQLFYSIDELETGTAYDLLVVPFKISRKDYAGKTIVVSPFASHNDRRLLYKTIDNIRIEKRGNFLNKRLFEMFNKGIGIVHNNDLNLKTKEEVLSFMSSALAEKGMIKDTFMDNVLLHETLTDSVSGKVAYPRSVETDGVHTSISIFLSETPVKWGNKEVHAVILFTNTDQGYRTCMSILTEAMNALKDKASVSNLLKAENFEDIKKIILH